MNPVNVLSPNTQGHKKSSLDELEDFHELELSS